LSTTHASSASLPMLTVTFGMGSANLGIDVSVKNKYKTTLLVIRLSRGSRWWCTHLISLFLFYIDKRHGSLAVDFFTEHLLKLRDIVIGIKQRVK